MKLVVIVDKMHNLWQDLLIWSSSETSWVGRYW